MNRKGKETRRRLVSRRQFLKASAAGVVGATVLATVGTQAFAATEADASEAYVDGEHGPVQTMEGFGASGAWWVNDLVNFDSAVQRKVGDMLFGDDGIALSVYRYNIGGGGVGVPPGPRAAETFLVSPGVYDWTKDPGGRLFLNLAEGHDVPILIGFVNSAPVEWTTNHQNQGGYLIPGKEPEYARYLADIVSHFRDSEAITLSYISPMNEPDSTFGGSSQEGMAVPTAQRAALVQAVGKALADRTPYSRVIADESSTLTYHFIPEVPRWMSVPGTAQYVAALAHHTYDYPSDSTRRTARQVAESLHKPTWMTEVCCWNGHGFGAQYDPTMSSALWMTNSMIRDLTVTNDAAWHWWVALSSGLGFDPVSDPDGVNQINDQGWNDGLLYYDPNYKENGNQRIYTTKRYWAMGNFSRYVRPGALRYDVNNVPSDMRVAAFYDTGTSGSPGPNGKENRWVVVAINNASSPQQLRLRLPGESQTLSHVEAYETSADKDLERVDIARAQSDGALSATLAGESITTILLRAHGPGRGFVAADTRVEAPDLAPPGRAFTATATFTNYDDVPVNGVRLALDLPNGWSATSDTNTSFGQVAPGETVEASWTVRVPNGAQSGDATVQAVATFSHGAFRGTSTDSTTALVPPAPPTKDTYLSDMQWISAANDWGPVERDTSNGENQPGDGHTITINGVTYAKGLGINAPAEIDYYLGGSVQRLISDVGVDDEVGGLGSVVFQVYADDRKVYESSLLTGNDGAEHLDVSVAGADVLRLVVTDGGDNPYSDHADWAGARVVV